MSSASAANFANEPVASETDLKTKLDLIEKNVEFLLELVSYGINGRFLSGEVKKSFFSYLISAGPPPGQNSETSDR